MTTSVDIPPPGAPPSRERWIALAIVCVALLLVVIDVTVLHIAVPALSEDLRPTSVGLLWIIDVYPLVVAPLLVAFGTLGDRVGRKRVMLVGFVVFGVGSALAASAGSTEVLIAARAVLGVGGAMIMPATLSIIRAVFTDRRERVFALGIWSAVAAGGAAFGPLLGGVLVEHWWWGAVFLINVPIVVVLVPVTVRLLPESRSSAPPPSDATSVAWSIFGVLGLAFGIKQLARHGVTDGLGVVALVLGVGLLVAFTRRQLRRPEPLLDVRLFADRGFSTAVACVLLSMFGLVGLELFFAQYLQLVLGLEPVAAAVRLMPLMLASVLGGLLAGRLLRRLGVRLLIGAGMGLSALALVALLALGVDDRPLLLAVAFAAIGFGLESSLVAASDAIMAASPVDRAGGAAAIEATAYDLGGGLGVAVLGSVMANVYVARLPPVPGVSPADMQAARESLGGAADVAASLPPALGERLLDAAREAFVVGLHVTMVASIVLLVLAAVAAATQFRGRVDDAS